MSTLYVDNLEPNLGSRVLAAGHVVQVVNETYTTQVTTTGTSFIDTGLTASITPTSTSSKILILVSQHLEMVSSPDTNAQHQLSLVITDGSNNIIFGQSGNNQFRVKEQYAFAWQANLNAIHSPNTTSSFTYKTRFKVQLSNNTSAVVQDNNHHSNITLMEIAQ